MGFSGLLMPVALTILEELGELLGAVQDSSPYAKESDASGFTGSEESDAGDAQTLGCLFLGK